MAPTDPLISTSTNLWNVHEDVVFCKTKDAFGGLSNMCGGYPITLMDETFRTSEALYQACRFPHHPAIQRLIQAERSPMAAKMVAKKYRAETRPDWDDVRVPIMRWCLQMKLACNFANFAELLLSTEGRMIVERSAKDPFWGACKTADDAVLSGQNVLGWLEMELYDCLIAEPDALLSVTLPVEGMLLFGHPIITTEAFIAAKVC